MSEQLSDIVYAFAQTPEAMYVARASGLYCSMDNAKTWHNALARFQEEQSVASIVVTDIAYVAGLLFAATTGGILRSEDGETWEAVPFRKPTPTLSALVASPNFAEDHTLLAATLEDGVFRSDNSGKRWLAWNIGLLDQHVLSLVIVDNLVYVGTETGLFASYDIGRSWEVVELPFSDAILSLLLTEDALYVGTENSGLYRYIKSWEKLELPPGSVNQLLLLSGPYMLVLLDDGVYNYCTEAKAYRPWRGLEGVSCLAVFDKTVFVGSSNGEVKVENL